MFVANLNLDGIGSHAGLLTVFAIGLLIAIAFVVAGLR